LNAEYACSITVLEPAMHPPRTLAMQLAFVVRPVHSAAGARR